MACAYFIGFVGSCAAFVLSRATRRGDRAEFLLWLGLSSTICCLCFTGVGVLRALYVDRVIGSSLLVTALYSLGVFSFMATLNLAMRDLIASAVRSHRRIHFLQDLNHDIGIEEKRPDRTAEVEDARRRSHVLERREKLRRAEKAYEVAWTIMRVGSMLLSLAAITPIFMLIPLWSMYPFVVVHGTCVALGLSAFALAFSLTARHFKDKIKDTLQLLRADATTAMNAAMDAKMSSAIAFMKGLEWRIHFASRMTGMPLIAITPSLIVGAALPWVHATASYFVPILWIVAILVNGPVGFILWSPSRSRFQARVPPPPVATLPTGISPPTSPTFHNARHREKRDNNNDFSEGSREGERDRRVHATTPFPSSPSHADDEGKMHDVRVKSLAKTNARAVRTSLRVRGLVDDAVDTHLLVNEWEVGHETLMYYTLARRNQELALRASKICASDQYIALTSVTSLLTVSLQVVVLTTDEAILSAYTSFWVFLAVLLVTFPLCATTLSLPMMRELLKRPSVVLRLLLSFAFALFLMDVVAYDHRSGAVLTIMFGILLLPFMDAVTREGMTGKAYLLLAWLCAPLPLLSLILLVFDLIANRRDTLIQIRLDPYLSNLFPSQSLLEFSWSTYSFAVDSNIGLCVLFAGDFVHLVRRRGLKFFHHIASRIDVIIVPANSAPRVAHNEGGAVVSNEDKSRLVAAASHTLPIPPPRKGSIVAGMGRFGASLLRMKSGRVSFMEEKDAPPLPPPPPRTVQDPSPSPPVTPLRRDSEKQFAYVNFLVLKETDAFAYHIFGYSRWGEFVMQHFVRSNVARVAVLISSACSAGILVFALAIGNPSVPGYVSFVTCFFIFLSLARVILAYSYRVLVVVGKQTDFWIRHAGADVAAIFSALIVGITNPVAIHVLLMPLIWFTLAFDSDLRCVRNQPLTHSISRFFYSCSAVVFFVCGVTLPLEFNVGAIASPYTNSYLRLSVYDASSSTAQEFNLTQLMRQAGGTDGSQTFFLFSYEPPAGYLGRIQFYQFVSDLLTWVTVSIAIQFITVLMWSGEGERKLGSNRTSPITPPGAHRRRQTRYLLAPVRPKFVDFLSPTSPEEEGEEEEVIKRIALSEDLRTPIDTPRHAGGQKMEEYTSDFDGNSTTNPTAVEGGGIKAAHRSVHGRSYYMRRVQSIEEMPIPEEMGENNRLGHPTTTNVRFSFPQQSPTGSRPVSMLRKQRSKYASSTFSFDEVVVDYDDVEVV